MVEKVRIIGAGLSGSEAALQCAKRGVCVELYEMRPLLYPPAHKTDDFAELVCSNSFKSTDIRRSAGLLKRELKETGSILIAVAEECAIPGGASLVVERDAFSKRITELVKANPLITIKHEVVADIRELQNSCFPLVVACGPNTTLDFWRSLEELFGEQNLYFFDATSPIVGSKQLDRAIIFEASRYDKGGGEGYLNIPLNKIEYQGLLQQLVTAETTSLSPGEDLKLYEGCLPVEELAKRGIDTLRFGAFKPVGLRDPRDGSRPYAVIQLRSENALKNAYSLVGFQTRMTQSSQEAIIRSLPGMSQIRFIRFGRMHRNNYLNSPNLLKTTLESHRFSGLFFAGQVTGLEGYQAAILTGLIAGINSALIAMNSEPILFPQHTVIGEAIRWLTDPSNDEFRPTAPVFGMWRDVPKMKKAEKSDWYAAQSDAGIKKICEEI